MSAPAPNELVLTQARDEDMPIKETTSLTPRSQYSLAATLMKQALNDQGITQDKHAGDSITQYYYPDEGCIVIDLESIDNE